MLLPRKQKFRKQFRGKRAGKAQVGNYLSFGRFGIKAIGRGWMTARQIEAARRAMTRYIKREGQVWIRIFPDKPITAQPAETGMGGGKGAVEQYVAVIKPGRVLFEMDGVAPEIAKEAMRLAQHKIGFATKFIDKQEILK